MKAEFQPFNGDWFKDCKKCSGSYGAEALEGLQQFFAKDAGKVDGLDAICKICRAKYRAENKPKER